MRKGGKRAEGERQATGTSQRQTPIMAGIGAYLGAYY